MLENPRNDRMLEIPSLEKFPNFATQVVEDANFPFFSRFRISIKVLFLGFSSMKIPFSRVIELSEHRNASRRCE